MNDKTTSHKPTHVKDLAAAAASYNPRQISDAQLDRLGKAMHEFGDLSGIVYNRRTGRLVAGHQRVKKLDPDLLLQNDPVNGGVIVTPAGERWQYREVDWDEQKEMAANLAANRQGGEWDDLKLGKVLEEIVSFGGDLELDLTGFDEQEIEERMLASGGGDVVEDDVPEPPENPITKPGDVWRLGEHRVMCGDATDENVVSRLCDKASVDFVFTSPPYNVGVKYGDHDDKTVSWSNYGPFIAKTVRICEHVLRPGRMMGWNIGTMPKTYFYHQCRAIEAIGMKYLRLLIWQKVGVPVPMWFNTKNNPVAREFHPNPIHEIILLFSKGVIEKGEPVKFDDTLEHDVFKMSQSMSTRNLPDDPNASYTGTQHLDRRSRKVHPAPYPVKLPASFIAHLCDVGEPTYDPFLGSGTTLIAAEQLNRICYAMEIEPRYVDVTVQRWQNLTGRKAERKE